MISVEVNDKVFTGFTKISLVDSVDQLCNQFTLECSADDYLQFPIPRGSTIKVKVNDKQILTGFVEGNKGSYSAESYSIVLQGRDDTRAVLKADLPPKFNVRGEIQMKAVMEKTLAQAGIDLTVIDATGGIDPFTTKEVLTDDTGGTIWDFWLGLAEKRQVLITKDFDGNILILRPNQLKYKKQLYMFLNDFAAVNNIIQASWDYNDANRRHEYNVYSQANVTVPRTEAPPAEGETYDSASEDKEQTAPATQNADAIAALQAELRTVEPGSEQARILELQISSLTGNPPGQDQSPFITKRTKTRGTAYDYGIPPGSVSNEPAENPSDNDECEKQAQWNANKGRVNSFTYSCKVNDLIGDNSPWRSGVLIDVVDEIASVDSTLLIKQVEFIAEETADGKVEEYAQLSFTIPDGYTDAASASDSQKQTAEIGGNWNLGNFQ